MKGCIKYLLVYSILSVLEKGLHRIVKYLEKYYTNELKKLVYTQKRMS